jgi:succinyl-CoA synthetase beta subunit
MNIHEYQGKDVLRRYGVASPRGFLCHSPQEAEEAALRLGGRTWMVKAQVHAARRGNGEGVKQAWTVPEVRKHAGALLDGVGVRRLLVEERTEISQAFALGMAVDRDTQRVVLMASDNGSGAVRHTVFIDPVTGLTAGQADGIARRIGIPGKSIPQARTLMQNLYRAFDECDASRAEIDPLVLTGDGRVIALDVRFGFDPNALYRQPEIAALRDLEEEDAVEIEAAKFGLCYVTLGGDIGTLVNGAGLAMATMDAIRLYGGSPANFLDVGGGATAERVTEAFKLMLRNPKLRAILVNVFGGIMRCDLVAQSVVDAARELELRVPLVVRMKGRNEALGRSILAASGLPIIGADDMADAAAKAVAAARGH